MLKPNLRQADICRSELSSFNSFQLGPHNATLLKFSNRSLASKAPNRTAARLNALRKSANLNSAMRSQLLHRLPSTICSRCRLNPRCVSGFQLQLRAARQPSHRTHATSGGRGYNPLDHYHNHRRAQSSVQNEVTKFKRLSLAALVCMGIMAGIVLTIDPSGGAPKPGSSQNPLKADSSQTANGTFQGKKVVVAPGGAKLLAHDATGEEIELVPTGNSSVPHFPKTIHLPADPEADEKEVEYTLMGLGIRSVSFIGLQVYVVGLYVRTSSLAKLQSRLIKRVNPLATTLIPGEKEELRTSLLDAEASYRIWDDLLRDTSHGFESAFRVVPTRGTDFQHLRDGWVRGITAKTQAATLRGDKEFMDESFGKSVKDFSSVFGGKGKAPKGSVVLLSRDGHGRLDLMYQASNQQITHLGSIGDERIARLIWLGYLGGKTVSSEPARKEIVNGIIGLVERPVGTAAAKVA